MQLQSILLGVFVRRKSKITCCRGRRAFGWQWRGREVPWRADTGRRVKPVPVDRGAQDKPRPRCYIERAGSHAAVAVWRTPACFLCARFDASAKWGHKWGRRRWDFSFFLLSLCARCSLMTVFATFLFSSQVNWKAPVGPQNATSQTYRGCGQTFWWACAQTWKGGTCRRQGSIPIFSHPIPILQPQGSSDIDPILSFFPPPAHLISDWWYTYDCNDNRFLQKICTIFYF